MKQELTRLQKRRVAVAKDVLASLKVEILRQGTGYCQPRRRYHLSEGDSVERLDFTDLFKEGDSRKIAEAAKKECTVCGIGSLFLSLVAMENKFNFVIESYDIQTIYLSGETVRERLWKVFTKDQVYKIEEIFECHAPDSAAKLKLYAGGRDYYKFKFALQFPDAKERMAAVARNMIRNKGEFVLPGVKASGKKAGARA